MSNPNVPDTNPESYIRQISLLREEPKLLARPVLANQILEAMGIEGAFAIKFKTTVSDIMNTLPLESYDYEVLRDMFLTLIYKEYPDLKARQEIEALLPVLFQVTYLQQQLEYMNQIRNIAMTLNSMGVALELVPANFYETWIADSNFDTYLKTSFRVIGKPFSIKDIEESIGTKVRMEVCRKIFYILNSLENKGELLKQLRETDKHLGTILDSFINTMMGDDGDLKIDKLAENTKLLKTLEFSDLEALLRVLRNN